ncbi:antifreeze protein, type I [Polymorphobacter glacialis]|uniref:Antifreeze protein, type I n=1 Tax=Sandarakinorhabdus glacialis TaxID=1614636 RepID=A0A917A0P4_9SPHN|nr:SPFH domain-containing protein [Polymorphobacter glacialis]GGE20048.1 antifreeze protein, type I [Polymorphobacter glacialis]
MGLGDFFRKQLVDVIDWTDEPGVLGVRYPIADREIQHGGQLTVREGQAAIFMTEGQVADRFGAGQHTLDTATLPLLSSLENWKTGFQAPFKSDVYFFSLRQQIDRKWGTTQPITLRDKDFGTIRLRAFGRYGFAIADPAKFFDTLMGNLERYTVDEVEPQLRAAIATGLAAKLGAGEVPFLDLAANQTLLSDTLKAAIAPAFEQYGLALSSFYVESLSLPEEVQAAIDKSSSIRALGDLDAYTKFQAAESISVAAANQGGVAGIGASAAAGMAIGSAMSGGLQSAAPAAAAPAEDPFVVIGKLHTLMTAGAITQAEFDAKKAALLAKI